MIDTSVNKLIKNVLDFQYNPALIQRAVLSTLTEVTNGEIEIVDPTSPFVFCIEAMACCTAGFMMQNEALNRKQYASAAQTPEDLYLHMSDRDYINRFAIPADTQFTIGLPIEEILVKMVIDTETGIRKLVIPRNTYFTVAETTFSLQYPIEIRQLAHGGLQVVHDVSVVSPLQALTSNVIEHEIRRTVDSEWLFFSFDVQQFDIISQTSTLNSAIDFKIDIEFTNQYYHARVYTENAAGNWVEIATTHSEQVYDIATPTSVLRVVEQTLSVKIPQIYTGTGMLNKGIRIDVYQTKGPLNLNLSEYPFTAYGAVWQAYDKADNTVYSAPLKTFRTVVIYSDNIVSGGSNALTFAELQQRVVQNAIGAQQLPITPVQVEVSLRDKGYQIVRNIDNITQRVFQATKEMPQPIDTKLITAAAASIETLSISLRDAVQIDSVINNGDSVTITPDTLYRNHNGVIKIVPTSQLDYLLGLTVDKRALLVTQGSYLYTPFHYVLDTTNNAFESRPYYLDNPEISTKLFVSENDSALLQAGTGAYSIKRTATGYQIQIVTQSGEGFKALDDDLVHVQLAFVPSGEKDRAYLNGTLIGKTETGERYYTFDLSTNFNVDKNDNLQLSKFTLYTTESRLTGVALLTDFDLIYSTSSVMGSQWQPDGIDQTLGRFLLPGRIAGISHEKLRVRFGYSLKTLWAKCRSVISSVPFQTHEVDVPRLYEKNIYQRDENGSSISFDSEGNPVSVILHAKDDPVLDSEGNPVYQYLRGDVVKDANGYPITTDVRGMLRQIDLMLIEGAYWFATDITATKYRSTLTATVVNWLTTDLTELQKQLLDQTRIYFYPKTTMGTINVLTGEGIVKSISAGQAFRLDLFVSKAVYANSELRDRLTKSTISTINEQLKRTTVTLDGITKALREQYGNDVISVQISGLGGASNLPALTITDDADRCSIRKRLVALPDDSLIVEEDITIDFIKHEVRL
jgi:hypothetical protein